MHICISLQVIMVLDPTCKIISKIRLTKSLPFFQLEMTFSRNIHFSRRAHTMCSAGSLCCGLWVLLPRGWPWATHVLCGSMCSILADLTWELFPSLGSAASPPVRDVGLNSPAMVLPSSSCSVPSSDPAIITRTDGKYSNKRTQVVMGNYWCK